MLQSLCVRDVLLIKDLEVDFHENLGVLTGETGAGKSILLDALGFVLGERGNSALVRKGAQQAQVTALFTLPPSVQTILEDQSIPFDPDDGVLIKRTLNTGGKSKAYINDELVSVSLLKKMGTALVEIHGQFDHLLEAATHRETLDRFGKLSTDVQEVGGAYQSWKKAHQAFTQAQTDVESLRSNHDFLKMAVEELSALVPEDGEEEKLVEERAFLANKTKLTEAVEACLEGFTGEKGIESANNSAYRSLQRIVPLALGKAEPILETLDRLGNEAQEAVHQLRALKEEMGGDPNRLNDIEDRLYDLRGMARKYSCSVIELPQLFETYKSDLSKLNLSDDQLTTLGQEVSAQEALYLEKAHSLSKKRKSVAGKLSAAIQAELGPLKLDTAELSVEIVQNESGFAPSGMDEVEFKIKTNPGTPPGPLKKIASGGERSRFMLALRVVLADQDHIPTLIFDEIDSGVGGAVAAAIGERLSKLSQASQVLVVTHSPQVAAYGNQHLKVEKTYDQDSTLTTVTPLTDSQRQEELARMLAGKSITEEARAAAHKLLDHTKVA